MPPRRFRPRHRGPVARARGWRQDDPLSDGACLISAIRARPRRGRRKGDARALRPSGAAARLKGFGHRRAASPRNVPFGHPEFNRPGLAPTSYLYSIRRSAPSRVPFLAQAPKISQPAVRLVPSHHACFRAVRCDDGRHLGGQAPNSSPDRTGMTPQFAFCIPHLFHGNAAIASGSGWWIWNARWRYRCWNRLPSWGWSQLSW